MGINFLPWVRRKLFLRLQVITDSRDYTGGRVDAFQRIIMMSGYSSFLTRNFVLNGPCLDRPASFSAIMCSLSTFTVWRSIRPPGIPFTVLTTGWLDIRDSELKWMRLLQWPQEMRVLSVTPDLHHPLREPVVREVIRSWQFQCVHVFPFSPTGYNCQVNINECASNPCLNQGTCFDDISGYTCHCALPYTGEYCRPEGGVCSVRGGASTCVSVAQVREAALRTQGLVALGLTGFAEIWQQWNSLLYVCLLVFVGFYLFVFVVLGIDPQALCLLGKGSVPSSAPWFSVWFF